MYEISYIAGSPREAGAPVISGVGPYDTTALLEKALPILEVSNRILANNVANANTPGFTPITALRSYEANIIAIDASKKLVSRSLDIIRG